MSHLRNIFGTTPITLDEVEELIPNHITTQMELNEWEQLNIMEAQLWLNRKHPKIKELLNDTFIRRLHEKMFGKTWRWAGKFRKTNKNIGIDWYLVPTQLRTLFDDVIFYITNKVYLIDEIAVRFHHRLVLIHPFVNGNGRLSRIITDLFLSANNQPAFSWGSSLLKEKNDVRKQYIDALRTADIHDYSILSTFVRK